MERKSSYPRIRYDAVTDRLEIDQKSRSNITKTLRAGKILVDLDSEGEVVGVEILFASQAFTPDLLTALSERQAQDNSQDNSQKELPKITITSPSRGLIPLAPGLFVSKRSVEEIRADVEREDKLKSLTT